MIAICFRLSQGIIGLAIVLYHWVSMKHQFTIMKLEEGYYYFNYCLVKTSFINLWVEYINITIYYQSINLGHYYLLQNGY